MTDPIPLNELERMVLIEVFNRKRAELSQGEDRFRRIAASKRDFTGAGFFTHFSKNDDLKLGPSGFSERGGQGIRILLNGEIETGYVIYVDDGYLNCIEGFTYGDPWPDKIHSVQMIDP